MKLVRLQATSGRYVWLNPRQVLAVSEPSRDDAGWGDRPFCVVRVMEAMLREESYWLIDGHADVIAQRINEALDA